MIGGQYKLSSPPPSQASRNSDAHQLPAAQARTQIHEAEESPLLETCSRRMTWFLRATWRASNTDLPILLSGESGTGKNVMARQIHLWSGRDASRFLTLDCATLDEEMGAAPRRRNWGPKFLAERIFAMKAEHSVPSKISVFLDNVADLDQCTQGELLRFIENAGAHLFPTETWSTAGIQTIAATNRLLATEVANGHFRADLFDRINVIALRIPPLRERTEDILPLADYFLHRAIPPDHRGKLRISIEAASAIRNYSWPGNVRELRNAMERAAVLSQTDMITLNHLPEWALPFKSGRPASGLARFADARSLEEVEREHIERVLATSLTLQEAAALLGINATTLWRKRRRYHLV